ncbi:hypothetical protein SOASR030_19500 [Leminorella grimontii]|uniref:Autotransporter domain-containing protein n=1 Tax=Leminorella grimontii TaxID=82981 RepID=A0AAV5N4K0_9GAMM|nr:autotransporter outer membrane beta-barrel domain-containing protein [Leminorella grimontii]KFC93470.1 putative autotransporter protein [Leminorella grimontii ATCC 33999 = DSM 5078]GKX55838.1 hypothetical protein SOASR030_19500 [Leminorella grimontii]VFS55061.1 Outer membrane protein IcsA autotransporter precursor [Leminorella grimontii]
MEKVNKPSSNKPTTYLFKRRQLVGLISSILITATPTLSAQESQIIADAAHGSQTGLQGGVYVINGLAHTDAALIASGTGYEIQGSGLDIKLDPSITNNIGTLIYANDGGTISLDSSTITQGRVLATGEGSKLVLIDSRIQEDYSVVYGIELRDGAMGELNNVAIKGNMALSLLVVDASANIDNLNADSGIIAMAGSEITLKNSTVDALSAIGTGLEVDEASTAHVENTKLIGQISGLDIRDNSSVVFNGGSAIGNYKGVNLLSSNLTGSGVSLQGNDGWGVQATQGSTLILNNHSEIIGSLMVDSSSIDLTDVTIQGLNKPLGRGIFVANCIVGCGTFSLKRVDIDTIAAQGHGLHLSTGGQAEISGSNIVTHGEGAAGLYLSSSNVNSSASYINVSNSHIETAGDGAYGISLYTGNDSRQATSSLENVSLVTKGAGSAALSVQQGAAIIGTNVTADVQGENAAVLNFASGSSANHNSISLDGGSLSSRNGTAITAGGYSDISLKNLDISGSKGLLQAYNSASVDITFDHTNASGDTTATSDSAVNMALLNSSVLTGSINNSALTVDNSIWNVTGDSSVNGLKNSGTVNFTNMSGTGRTLTVNGDYIANDANLILNTVLGNDSSETDKLVVTGNTLGHTYLQVMNVGGLGDDTVNGINVISVGGQSDGIFTLKGRVGYGGYEYFLHKGDLAGNGGDWYLRSVYSDVTPTPPTPTEPTLEPEPVPEPVPAPTPTPSSKAVIEPEVGAYIGNQAVANTLFNLNLHDRMGEPQFTAKGDSLAESMWLRVVGSHEKNHAADGRLEVQTNASVVQLGGDIIQWSTGESRTHLGLMAGYGDAHLTSDSRQVGYSAKSDIKGYNVGVYATWYANQDLHQDGLYVDSWLQHNWFDNDVNGDERSTISYKSKGYSASLETGYTLKIGEFNQSALFIQPQAQIIWSAIHADKVNDGRGSIIDSGTPDYWQSRVGARTYLQGRSPVANDQIFQPFVEVNWLHSNENYGVDYKISQGSRRYESDTAKDIAEVKIGIEGKLTNNFAIWGNIGQQFDADNYSRTSGTLGIKYQF